jgi:cobalt/nickel transport system permease protein
VLGYYAFPAILIGLFFQAVMFQHGGLTSLGVNATVMGGPALLSHYLFRLRALALRRARPGQERLWTGLFGFTAGAVAIGVSALVFMVLLIATIPSHLDVEAERASIYTLALAHVPLMLIEGVFTALVAVFLQRVRPELLENP